ncbi:oxygen-dependent coproporphyrinogen oxidase [Curvivirga aplysinae]|uniref:oxygen-dependent coproporphyrinogen oxidase n=1 Tax=Curvivirga aplysinae TaxID=2529852 RepID=UPI0012BD4DAC|nr:oxygen-dependent coproporphyrinogen oxidase [Curvivirga aplysinae]MTI09240.1 oxygen-dependent coproporphyrinogen oxidase [Curvivirga aplysinae]
MTDAAFSQELQEKQDQASQWFKSLRDQICAAFEAIEDDLSGTNADKEAGRFERKTWERPDSEANHGGGGEMSIMRGRVFEKVGVNISKVHGVFSEQFRKEINGAEESDGQFWASGISLVAHHHSPLVPAVHMNTRFICTSQSWFGGGADLNPMYEVDEDTNDFHNAFKATCDKYDSSYYPKFKKWCDEYFMIKHWDEPRGVGGIFYDSLNTGDWSKDFSFTQDVGKTFLDIYPKLVRRHFNESWTEEQREWQLVKRGRYAEFNLVYDRGTRFGLMTGGNPEAVLMSLPPEAKWP